MLLPWACSRCCECSALFRSSPEVWGAQGLGTAQPWVLGPGAVWKGRRAEMLCPGPMLSLCSASALFTEEPTVALPQFFAAQHSMFLEN